MLYIFKAEPGIPIPDVTDVSKAVAALPLTDILQHQNIIYTNVPNAQSFSVRVDSTGSDALITEVAVVGVINGVMR